MTGQPTAQLLAEVARRTAEHPFAVLVWVDGSGYPMQRPLPFEVLGDELRLPAAVGPLPPEGTAVAVIVSRVRPLPGGGYEGRRYWTFHGRVRYIPGGLAVRPERVAGWREDELHFVALCERAVPQAHRYFAHLRQLYGRAVGPRLPAFWLLLRATRLPFLTATLIPVLLGTALAVREGSFSLPVFGLALVGAALIHLGLNVANDIFDTLAGADPLNPTPTPFSGGSRVIQYGLLSLRQMALLAAALYGGGALVGLILGLLRGWEPILWLGIGGILLSLGYTAPPLRLAYRGLGELAVAAGFGPVMTLGAYAVQTGRLEWTPLTASLPVGLLIGLVLYVNEVPDRVGDAAAGKRTLVVRLPHRWVVWVYGLGVGMAYLLIGAGVILGRIPPGGLAAWLTVPLAVQVGRRLAGSAQQPYELIPAMATQIRLHLYVGLVLAASYLLT